MSIDVVFREEQIGPGNLHVFASNILAWDIQTRYETYDPQTGNFSFEFRFVCAQYGTPINQFAGFAIYFGDSHSNTTYYANDTIYSGNWTLVNITENNSQSSLLTNLQLLYVNLLYQQ